MDVTLTAIAWLCWPNDFTTSTVGASLALIFFAANLNRQNIVSSLSFQQYE